MPETCFKIAQPAADRRDDGDTGLAVTERATEGVSLIGMWGSFHYSTLFCIHSKTLIIKSQSDN